MSGARTRGRICRSATASTIAWEHSSPKLQMAIVLEPYPQRLRNLRLKPDQVVQLRAQHVVPHAARAPCRMGPWVANAVRVSFT